MSNYDNDFDKRFQELTDDFNDLWIRSEIKICSDCGIETRTAKYILPELATYVFRDAEENAIMKNYTFAPRERWLCKQCAEKIARHLIRYKQIEDIINRK